MEFDQGLVSLNGRWHANFQENRISATHLFVHTMNVSAVLDFTIYVAIVTQWRPANKALEAVQTAKKCGFEIFKHPITFLIHLIENPQTFYFQISKNPSNESVPMTPRKP